MSTTPAGTEAGVETSVAAALVRLSHLVNHVFTEVSRDYDLTPQQTQLLCLLTTGPVGMTEITRTLHLEKSSVSGLVDRVERRGLVERVRDPDDRRAMRIVLTEQGERFAVDSHDQVTARLEEMVAELPADDRRRMVESIHQVIDLRWPAPAAWSDERTGEECC